MILDFFCAEYESGLRVPITDKGKAHLNHKCSECENLYPCEEDYDIWCSNELCSIGKKCGFIMKEKSNVREK